MNLTPGSDTIYVLSKTATGTIWCLIVVYIASFLSRLLTQSPRAFSIANKATGCIYILLGLNVLAAKQSG